MWQRRIGRAGFGRPNLKSVRGRRVRFESLESRLAMTWAGTPPTSITPPTGATAIVLDSENDAAGSASISGSEVDFYTFIAPVSGQYTVSASTGLFSTLDTVVGLFSATGTRLAFNDDISDGNTDSRLTVNLSAARRYYVGITNYFELQHDNYTWAIEGPNIPAAPSIELWGSGLTASNATAFGKTITVQAQVQNTGNTDAGTFLVRWYLARNSTATTGRVALQLSGQARSSVRVENLGAGETMTIDVTLRLPSRPSGWSGSRFYVVMGSDVGHEVSEVYENNNLAKIGIGFDSRAITIGTSTPTTGSFSIRLETTGLTSSQHDIFKRAVNRWKEVITGDLPNATYRGESVDDLLIHASSVAIDGVNGILGQAGPDAFRSGSLLPYHGSMEFDSADMRNMERNGTLYAVVLHEIGHILGIGTIWDYKGLLVGAGTSNPRFTGSRATAAYNSIFGANASGVPVENTGGGGTRDSHWRESILTTELMTGWVGPGTNLPMSRITVASLADLGYTVDMSKANSFSPSASARAAAQAASGTSTSIVGMEGIGLSFTADANLILKGPAAVRLDDGLVFVLAPPITGALEVSRGLSVLAPGRVDDVFQSRNLPGVDDAELETGLWADESAHEWSDWLSLAT